MKKKIVHKKSAKKNGGRILAGALVGAAIGVGAGLLLASGSGKKIGAGIKKMSGEFYRYVAPRLKKLKKIGEAEYHQLMIEGANDFSKAKKLSLAEGRALSLEAKRSWGHIKKHLL